LRHDHAVRELGHRGPELPIAVHVDGTALDATGLRCLLSSDLQQPLRVQAPVNGTRHLEKRRQLLSGESCYRLVPLVALAPGRSPGPLRSPTHEPRIERHILAVLTALCPFDLRPPSPPGAPT